MFAIADTQIHSIWCLCWQQEEFKRKDKERKKAEKDAQQVCVIRNIMPCI